MDLAVPPRSRTALHNALRSVEHLRRALRGVLFPPARNVLRKREELRVIRSQPSGLHHGRVDKAVALSLPAHKLTWAASELPASEVEENAYVGSLPDSVTFTPLDPALAGEFVGVHFTRSGWADRAAARIAGARSLTPAEGGRPDAPRHRPPLLTRGWSSPGVVRHTETRTDGGVASTTTSAAARRSSMSPATAIPASFRPVKTPVFQVNPTCTKAWPVSG